MERIRHLLGESAVRVDGGATLDALAETTMSSKPRDSKCSQNATALATSLSASGQSRSRYSSASEPALTPIRIGMPAVPCSVDHGIHPIERADVARVDAQFGCARRAASMARVWSKWTSAATGIGDSAHTAGETVQRLGPRDGDPDDLAPYISKCGHLLECGSCIARVGRGHRLYRDGRATADRHTPHHDRPGLASFGHLRPPSDQFWMK
jgi:hypothetical protein